MKNKNVKFLLHVAIFFIFFICTISGFCYASGIAIGDESIQLDFYGNDAGVYYIITDPQGRRVGYDSATQKYIEEFPASFDFSLKIRDEISEKFHSSAEFNLITGNYTIEVIGVGLTSFDVNIGISRGIMSEGIKGVDFDGVIDKGLTSKFQFTYNSDPTKPAGTAKRIATSASLKQDIILARKTGDVWRDENGDVIKVVNWIDNDGIMKSLLSKAEAIEASIAKGNKAAAKNQLNALISEVNAQKGKHISDKAVKILLEDAQYLMESLAK